MRSIKLAAASAFALVGVLNAQAQGNKTRVLSLDDCIQLALQNNLDIRIEQRNPAIVRLNLEGSYAAYDPVLAAQFSRNFTVNTGPSFNFSDNTLTAPAARIANINSSLSLRGTLPTGLTYTLSENLGRSETVGLSENYNSGISFSLSQPLLRDFQIDGPRLTIELNKRSIQTSEEALLNQVMSVISRVEDAYYDLIYSRENLKVQVQGLQLAEKSLSENKKRVEVGALAPLDEKQSESEVAARKSDLLGAEQTLRRQQNLLASLLGDNFRDWVDNTIEPRDSLTAVPAIFNRAESWNNALYKRPDLRQLRIELERDDLTLKYRKNQLLPSLAAFGGYGQAGRDNSPWDSLHQSLDGSAPNYNWGLSLSMPLGNRAARTTYRATKEQRLQSELILQRAEQTALINVENAISTAKTALELISSTRLAREFAEAALDAEQKKLENGKSTSFVVLRLQRDVTSARSSEIRALSEYNKALNALSLTEGTVLERRKIDFSVK
jgi:outer membrane protein TolC